MPTFTSSLPDDLLRNLADKSAELDVPKNKILEKALRVYLEHLEKAAYRKSYKMAGEDLEIMSVAEEGMADYLDQLEG